MTRSSSPRKLEASAEEKGIELILPTDVIVADKFAADAATQTVSVDEIPEGWMGLDNGPDSTASSFQAELADCKTVIWNGPMGVFEMEAFNKGTFGVCDTLANLDAITIIGGGDSVAAVEMAGLADKMSHISTGGGASLELLEGKVLPGATRSARRCSSRRKLLPLLSKRVARMRRFRDERRVRCDVHVHVRY